MCAPCKIDEDSIRQRVRAILRQKANVVYQGPSIAGGATAGGATAGGATAGGRRRRKGGAWYDFLDPQKNGFNDAMSKVSNEFTNPNSVLRGQIIPKAEQVAKVAAQVAPLVGLGTAGGKKYVRKGPSPKMRKRNALIARLMKEKGMTLPQASSYIKQHDLA